MKYHGQEDSTDAESEFSGRNYLKRRKQSRSSVEAGDMQVVQDKRPIKTSAIDEDKMNKKRRRSLEYEELMMHVDQSRKRQENSKIKLRKKYSSSEDEEEEAASNERRWRQRRRTRRYK